MEEDIRLIENTIFNIEMTNSDYKYCDDNECWLSENQVKAIQNIIQGYKDQKCKADIQDATIKNMKDFMEQLEKELEPIRELGIPVKTVVAELNRLEDLEDDREQLKHSIKEYQKIVSGYIADYCERCDELRDSIPKSVIREKIEKLEEEKGKYDNTLRLYTLQATFDFQVEVLKELLGEE